jgi:hypothetical protein
VKRHFIIGTSLLIDYLKNHVQNPIYPINEHLFGMTLTYQTSFRHCFSLSVDSLQYLGNLALVIAVAIPNHLFFAEDFFIFHIFSSP